MVATIGGLTYFRRGECLRTSDIKTSNLAAAAEEEPTNQRFAEVVVITPFSNAANTLSIHRVPKSEYNLAQSRIPSSH